MAQRVTVSDHDIANMRGASLRRGIMPFLVDGHEVPAELTESYRGPVRQNFVPNAPGEEKTHGN